MAPKRPVSWLALLLAASVAFGCGARAQEYPRPREEGGAVLIPLREVADGGAHFFTVERGGKKINFFVRTDGKGRLHASLDACYACYRYRLGYRYEGDAVVCNACRMSFRLEEETWDYIGPCAPIPLPHKERDGFVWISSSRLEKCDRYF